MKRYQAEPRRTYAGTHRRKLAVLSKIMVFKWSLRQAAWQAGPAAGSSGFTGGVPTVRHLRPWRMSLLRWMKKPHWTTQ